jgi:hypothetical protein
MASMANMPSNQQNQVVYLRILIEQASADKDIKHLAGAIRSFDELVKPENLDRLAEQSPGILAYLAFHPVADTPVADYVKNGSLSSDSGNRILVLFTADKADWTPGYIDAAAVMAVPGVTIESGIHPSYTMIRLLFEPAPSPPLPGIAFFKGFSADAEAVYISLAGLESSLQVTERLRTVFSLVTEVGYPAPVGKFADKVSVALQKRRLPYVRSGSKSLREWFVRGYQVIYDHRSDIVAVAGLFIP